MNVLERMLVVVLLVALGGAACVLPVLVACTPAQRAAVASAVGDLAAEVCVEGDSVSVCLRKCSDADGGRRAAPDAGP